MNIESLATVLSNDRLTHYGIDAIIIGTMGAESLQVATFRGGIFVEVLIFRNGPSGLKFGAVANCGWSDTGRLTR